MSDWISWEKLLKRWDIRESELLEYLKKGLQPYSDYDFRPISCPNSCHEYFQHFDNYAEISKRISILKSRIDNDEKAEGLKSERNKFLEKLQKVEHKISMITNKDPDCVSWKYFVKPLEASDGKKVISDLKKEEAVFKKAEVVEFEKKFGLNSFKQIQTGKVKKAVFPCKAGTRWEDIKITLIEDETVRIETPWGKGRYSYHQLDMSDKRSGNKPTMLWFLFKLFAQNQGSISRTNAGYDSKLPDTAKRLNKHLQNLFEIRESIFTDPYKAAKGYKTKIFFSDQTIVA